MNWGRFARALVLVLAGAAAALVVAGHVDHKPTVLDMSSAGIHWTDVVTALSTAIGLVVGAAVAVLYGRKASASVAAIAHLIPTGVLIVARPAISGAGIFRIRFARGEEGAKVRVTEVFRVGSGLVDGRHWVRSAVFGDAFVEGGETLITSVVFPLDPPYQELVGWRVSFGVTCARLLWRGWSWSDQVFVPRP